MSHHHKNHSISPSYQHVKIVEIENTQWKKANYIAIKDEQGKYISVLSEWISQKWEEKILHILNNPSQKFQLTEKNITVSQKVSTFIVSFQNTFSDKIHEILEKESIHKNISHPEISGFFEYQNKYGQVFFVSVHQGKVISVGENDQDVSSQQKSAVQRMLNGKWEQAFVKKYKNNHVQEFFSWEKLLQNDLHSKEYNILYNLQMLFHAKKSFFARDDIDLNQKRIFAISFLKSLKNLFPDFLKNMKVNFSDTHSVIEYFQALYQFVSTNWEKYSSEKVLRENLIGEFKNIEKYFETPVYVWMKFQKTQVNTILNKNDRLFLYNSKDGNQYYILLWYHKAQDKKFISQAVPITRNSQLSEKEKLQINADINNLTNYSKLYPVERAVFKSTLDFVVEYYKKQEQNSWESVSKAEIEIHSSKSQESINFDMYQAAAGQKETFWKKQTQKTSQHTASKTFEKKNNQEKKYKIQQVQNTLQNVEQNIWKEVVHIKSVEELTLKQIAWVFWIYNDLNIHFWIFWIAKNPKEVINWGKQQLNLMYRRIHKAVYPRTGESSEDEKLFRSMRQLQDIEFFERWWNAFEANIFTAQEKLHTTKKRETKNHWEKPDKQALHLIQKLKRDCFLEKWEYQIPKYRITRKQTEQLLDFYTILAEYYGISKDDFAISWIHANIVFRSKEKGVINFLDKISHFLEQLDHYNPMKKSA